MSGIFLTWHRKILRLRSRRIYGMVSGMAPPGVAASPQPSPHDRRCALRLSCLSEGPLQGQLQRLRDLPAHGNRLLHYHHLVRCCRECRYRGRSCAADDLWCRWAKA
jgi:hypothetical protein